MLSTSITAFTPLIGATGILEVESVEYLFHLLGIVFFFLVSVKIVVDLLGKLFAPVPSEKTVPQPVAAPVPVPAIPTVPVAATPAPVVAAAHAADDHSEIIAVIAAAVASVVGGAHRIVSIEYAPTVSNVAWSMEGRRAIYASHSVRR